CHSPADRQRLEAWTNARLDEYYFDLVDPHHEMELMSDEKFISDTEQHIGRMLKQGRVIGAAKRKDLPALLPLVKDDPELLRLADHWLSRPHNVGREPGEPRPGDHSDMIRWSLPDASRDVEQIRRIWKRRLGFVNRKEDPTAVDIAARRWGLDPQTLINY